MITASLLAACTLFTMQISSERWSYLTLYILKSNQVDHNTLYQHGMLKQKIPN